MAADLEQEHGVRVERLKGGLGELSVSIDETKIFDGNRFWYPTPGGVITKVRAALSNRPPTPGVDDET